MKTMLKLALFYLACITAINAYSYAEDNNIINLGKPTFGFAYDEFPNGLLVYYYEPFCFLCRKMWPELVETATTLRQQNSKIRVAKVECHDEIKLCDEKGVTTFPTLILYRKGKPEFEYRGPRTSEAMIAWAKKVVDNIFTTPAEDDIFRMFSTAILMNSNISPVQDAYPAFLDSIDIHIAPPKYASQIPPNGALIVSQNGLNEVISATDSALTVIQKVERVFNELKAVPNFNADLSAKFQKKEFEKYIFFFRTTKFNPNSPAIKAFDEMALTFRDKYQLNPAYVNVKDDILGKTIGKLFGVDVDHEMTVGILEKNGTIFRKYKFNQEINKNNLQAFANGYISSKLSRYYMSAVTPKKAKPYIKELTGATFWDAVGEEKINAFVLFYFPWCEWCVKLEPTWEALAYRMRHNKNVLIARIDMSDNDVEGFDISEFPVLIFFPAGKEVKYEVYVGQRNIKDLQNFLIEKIPGLERDLDL